MLKTAQFAFALLLLLPQVHDAAASTAPRATFSHGFSSRSPSPAFPSRMAMPAPKSGFGSFGRATAAAPDAMHTSGAAATPRQSDSALSRQLNTNAAQANALRTFDERRAAQQAHSAPPAATGPAPIAPAQPANVSMPVPAAPTTVIVQQGSGGLGHVLAGAMIARTFSGHAGAGYYPAPVPNPAAGGGAVQRGGGGFFTTFMWLCLLSLVGWGIWFAWRRASNRRALNRDANKPNYSFERN